MDGVVERIDPAGPAVDRHGEAGLNALVGFRGVAAPGAASAARRDGDVGVLRDKDCFRLDAVLAGYDRDRGINDGDEALVRVRPVLRADAVASGRDADRSLGELDGILSVQPNVCGVHGEGLGRDRQVVLGDHGVLVIAVDRQLARAVDREIVFAEHRRVQRGVFIREAVIRPVGDRVDRALRRGDKDLIRAADVDRGAVLVGDHCVLQHELDLILFPGLDHDHALIAARKDVHAGLRNRQLAVRRERRRFGGVVLARGVPFGHRGVRRRI